MRTPIALQICLLSDATFGRGAGTPGAVDVEIEHDDHGLPFVGGRTVRGLLRDGWLSMAEAFPELAVAAGRVLGVERDLAETGILGVGDARLVGGPGDGGIRADPAPWVAAAISGRRIGPADVLAALTTIRQQTAEDRATGAPRTRTLRASRAALSDLVFHAPLRWSAEPDEFDLRCLAMSALAVRHAGLGRNRGRGHIELALDGDLAWTTASISA